MVLASSEQYSVRTGRLSSKMGVQTFTLAQYRIYIKVEQKWKHYTTIIYILWESIGQKVFTKS